MTEATNDPVLWFQAPDSTEARLYGGRLHEAQVRVVHTPLEVRVYYVLQDKAVPIYFAAAYCYTEADAERMAEILPDLYALRSRKTED